MKIKYIRRLANKNFLMLLLLDAIIISISFYSSLLFRFDFQFSAQIKEIISLENIFILISIKIFCFRIFGLYRGMWRYTSVWDLLNIIKANSLSSSLIALIVFSTISFKFIGRSVFIIDYFLCLGLISSSRLGIRMFFTHVIDFFKPDIGKKNKRRILLIGGGDTGQNIIRQTFNSGMSVSIIAILDDDSSKIGSNLHGIPIISNIADLPILKLNFDEIFIAIPSASRKQLRRIVDYCKETGKPFKTLPSMNELVEGKISISQFREVSLVDLLGRKEVTLDKSSISDFIEGKRVLITGAGGSIGSELVRQCAKFKPSVLVLLDISELNLFQIEREMLGQNSSILIKPVLADIRDKEIINNIFNEFFPQVVFHAAAYKHVPMQEFFPSEAVKTNIIGTSNLADSAIKFKVKKFVLVSTDKAVRPTNVMGATKRLAEMVVQNQNYKNSNIEFMSVRFGNVLGSSGSVIPIFQEQIKNGGPLTVTDPDMKRYFMSIPEASQLILQAGSIGSGGEVFILDMGEPIKIIDIANELIRLSGFEPDIDIPVLITGTRPGEKKVEELSLPSENLDKTKHKKIFVLNDPDVENKKNKNLISKIQKLHTNINAKSANEIVIGLSDLLPEYKPSMNSRNSEYIKTNHEAEA